MRVFLLGSDVDMLLNFRLRLAIDIVARGHRMVACAPELLNHIPAVNQLRDLGIEAAEVSMARTGTNPQHDAATLAGLIRLMRRHRPDVLLAYTIKPVIYGTLAAWLAGVPRRYALITGLGYAFIEGRGLRWRIISRVSRALYRLALSRTSHVFFQNSDDLTLFRELGILAPSHPVTIVPGSGVDMDHFTPQPFAAGAPTFLFVGRLLKSKGVNEFVEAAAIVKRERPDARFLIAGGLDSNPDAISRQTIENWVTAGTVEWLGRVDDIRKALADAHVFVLPSYREGLPRSTIEAMASGRAIITTDAPGCRDTVVDGDNGYLVPVADSAKLATAMHRMLDQPAAVEEMGRRSIELARERFNVRHVNRLMLDELGL